MGRAQPRHSRRALRVIAALCLLAALPVASFRGAPSAPAVARERLEILRVDPRADIALLANHPTTNYGDAKWLMTKRRPEAISYLRFTLPTFDGELRNAILKMRTTKASGRIEVAAVEPRWTEDTARITRVEHRATSVLGAIGSTDGPRRVQLDVTDALRGHRRVGFLLTAGGRRSVLRSSEGGGGPRLVLRVKQSKAEPAPVTSPAPSAEPVKAFPTAEGFGAGSVGGRGGRVLEVTNLNDHGPGSLRAALEASGPRTVVFRVAGTIEVDSGIDIQDPFITIAGQTAPGDGITIKGSPSTSDAPLGIHTHDVIVRYLRVRAGPTDRPSVMRSAIRIEKAGGTEVHDVILDHVSVSWGVDDNITVIDGARDITVQWSVVSEALYDSTHPEGPHSMGVALSGKIFNTQQRSRDISLHHDLFAFDNERNPRIVTAGTVDVVNDVIYDWGTVGATVNDDWTTVPVNFVGNTFKAGRDTRGYEITGENLVNGLSLYVSGNVGPHRTVDQPERAILHPDVRVSAVGSRNPAPRVCTTDASTAYEQVLEHAGASLVRDQVDRRVIASVRDGTGRIIDDPSQVGGWPTLSSGTPLPDADNDGMDDGWEAAHGLDPSLEDGATVSPNGYTWLENFLNELAGDFDPVCV
jgi:pectate lyase